MEEQKDTLQEVKKQVEELIKTISEEKVNQGNVGYLFQLVDIHKDIENEEYWKKEESNMRYRGYNDGGNYGRRYGRSYSEGGNNYGRRGVDSKYQGEKMMDDMYGSYQAYQDGREQYGRGGNYGAKEDSMKSLEYMLMAMEDFVCYLMEDAESEEEKQMIRQTIKELGMK